MEKFSFIRHGDKLKAGETRAPLEESGLTDDQKRKWTDICSRLGIEDPQITYENLDKIEAMASKVYEQLPQRALVIFTSSDTPRTRFTAEYLLGELEAIVQEKNKKKIYTEVIGDSGVKGNIRSVGTTTIPREAEGILEKFKVMSAQDNLDEENLKEYFEAPHGGKTHPKEMELLFKVVNSDLQSGDSSLKKRADDLREQLKQVSEQVQSNELPIFFFGVGHMSTLISLDVAFNDRKSYEGVEEMPHPLALWEVENKK